jgi:hypothetical protein
VIWVCEVQRCPGSSDAPLATPFLFARVAQGELSATSTRYGLQAMGEGGGMANAIIIETL